MEAMATGFRRSLPIRGGPQELVEDGVTGFVADDRSICGTGPRAGHQFRAKAANG